MEETGRGCPPPRGAVMATTYLLGEGEEQQQGAGRAGHGAQRLLLEAQHVDEAPAGAHAEAGQHLRGTAGGWHGRSPSGPRRPPRGGDTAQSAAAARRQGEGKAGARRPRTHFVQHLQDNEGQRG